MPSPSIDFISPVNGLNQFPVTGELVVIFDTEVDAYSAVNSLLLTGPSNDLFVGPGMNSKLGNGWNPYEAALKGEGYSSLVECRYIVEKVDGNGDLLEDQFTYGPSGLERTRVRLVPRRALAESTDFRFFINSDPSVTNLSSIGTRSVFDARPDPANTSEGTLVSSGVYTGENPDTLTIFITKSGPKSTLRYTYQLASNPSLSSQRSPTKETEVIPGVFVDFYGELEKDDVFTIELVPTEYMEGTTTVEFSTGAGHVLTDRPPQLSTSPIGSGSDIYPWEEQEFTLIGSKPSIGDSNVNPEKSMIVLQFSSDIDPTSIDSETVQLLKQSVDGSDFEKELDWSYSVNGNRLFIYIESHQP